MEKLDLSYFFFYSGFFIFKILIFFLFFVLASYFIILIFNNSKKKDSFIIDLIDVNKKFNNINSIIKRSILDKKEYKLYKKSQKNKIKSEELKYKNNKRFYVINFKGDIKVSDIESLRISVTALLNIVKKDDEIIVIIESPGGLVSNYGLAASQLERIRKQNINLTVIIDLVAASGGYLMACVANKIIAAPFSIVGSIGVVAQIPNLNRFLEKYNIDIEQHTSGQYKRTLTLLGKNTEEGRKKFRDSLEKTHKLFKSFVKKYRPEINIEKVSTGEYWYGLQAIELNLIDEIKTSDEFLNEKIKDHKVYEIKLNKKKSIKNKLQMYMNNVIYSIYYKITNKVI